jgi:SAM-dependent methyltransferase
MILESKRIDAEIPVQCLKYQCSVGQQSAMSLPSSTSKRSEKSAKVDLYGANYRNFAKQIYADIRRETFGEDIGQQSWLTSSEHDRFISWLDLKKGSRVLDIGCGAGGPLLCLQRLSGCTAFGLDNDKSGIEAAVATAEKQGQSKQARFKVFDASKNLPFDTESFDGLVCIDAINHLPNREQVLAEWARVSRRGGRILFTDPITVTGPLSSEEMAIRSSIGFFPFVPKGENERMLRRVGLNLAKCEDVTDNVALCAGRRFEARAARADALRKIEGNDTYAGQQEFLRVTEVLARERRLSRFAYLAEKT